ncbi:hypothetical protein FBU30_007398 [Linnemannia zychae]|nr:hypothetical protein FBU30_007398 [Linnemannia zychae]
MNTNRIATLPKLVENIASRLSHHDLNHCVRVSKSWHAAFIPILWRTFEDEVEKDGTWGRALSTAVYQREDDPQTLEWYMDVYRRHAPYIHHLTIYLPAILVACIEDAFEPLSSSSVSGNESTELSSELSVSTTSNYTFRSSLTNLESLTIKIDPRAFMVWFPKVFNYGTHPPPESLFVSHLGIQNNKNLPTLDSERPIINAYQRLILCNPRLRSVVCPYFPHLLREMQQIRPGLNALKSLTHLSAYISSERLPDLPATVTKFTAMHNLDPNYTVTNAFYPDVVYEGLETLEVDTIETGSVLRSILAQAPSLRTLIIPGNTDKLTSFIYGAEYGAAYKYNCTNTTYSYGFGYGSGYGSGYGFGYGSGYSAGYGAGYGSGNGSGNGSGYGFGYGSGYGTAYKTRYSLSYDNNKPVDSANENSETPSPQESLPWPATRITVLKCLQSLNKFTQYSQFEGVFKCFPLLAEYHDDIWIPEIAVQLATHCTLLEVIRIEKCSRSQPTRHFDWFPMNYIQLPKTDNMSVLLSSLPRLRVLMVSQGVIDASITLENPWVCMNLEELSCQITKCPYLTEQERRIVQEILQREADFTGNYDELVSMQGLRTENEKRIMDIREKAVSTRKAIFSRLSKMTSLKYLSLNPDFKDGMRIFQYENFAWSYYKSAKDGRAYLQYNDVRPDTLHLRLDCGLDQLASLIQLEYLGFESIDHQMEACDIEWIANHFPLLKEMRGLATDNYLCLEPNPKNEALLAQMQTLRPFVKQEQSFKEYSVPPEPMRSAYDGRYPRYRPTISGYRY